MLAAPKRDFQEINNKALQNARKGKRRKIKLSKVRILMVTSVLLAFVTGLGLASLTAELNAKGYELYQMQQDVEKMESTNQRLRLEIARLNSPQRVQQLAQEKLGMILPTSKDIQIVRLDEESYHTSVQESNILETTTYAEIDVHLKPQDAPWLAGVVQAVGSWLVAPSAQAEK